MGKSKLKDIATLAKMIRALKKSGKKIVFTNGCFDIIHRGHIKLLKKAKSLGDVLIVAINSDSSVKKIKGCRRPINSARDRAVVLSAIEFVDFVTVFKEPDPGRIIQKLAPSILVKGGDWKKEKIIGGAFVKSRGGRVHSIPLVKGYSTSRIVKRTAGERS